MASRQRSTQDERDALAAELREFYPEFETKTTDLLARITVNDEKLSRLRHAPPPGDPRLYTGEWWDVQEEQAQASAERAARPGG